MADARWLTEADVVATVDLRAAMAAVRSALELEHAGAARTLEKTAVAWGDGHTLHALGGVVDGLGVVGAKTWAHTAGGAEPLVVLWDEHSGSLLGVIEAFALGQLRTAAVSALAIDALAVSDASVFALIGTGKQAEAQAAAALAARSITTVRVYSPTREHRETFGERLRQSVTGCDVVVCDDILGAVSSADVVTAATRSRHPFLAPEMLTAHALVNALGAITRERAEVDERLVAEASIVVSDSPAAAQSLSSELRAAASIVPLSSVVHDPPTTSGRRIFKAMGLGLADVAVGAEVLRRAAASNTGTPIPPRRKAAPQLFSEVLA